MNFFIIEPEVSGGLGDRTIMDTSTHPPKIQALHYIFDGWSGDVIVTSFPCYLVTTRAKEAIDAIHSSGVSFASADTSKSETFEELFPGKSLPEFWWMKVNGTAGEDDFGIAPNLRLVISQKALDALRKLRLMDAIVTPYDS
jgi:hypothetical protein